MADIGAPNPEDNVGGDVGGVVCDALETARDEEAVDGLLGVLRLLLNELEQIGVRAAIHAVNLVVHFADRIGEAGIALKQGVNCGADHAAGVLAHGREVDGQVDIVGLHDVAGAARDAHGLIADAFEVAVDFDDGEDKAEIDGHGLLFGEEFVGHLVEFALSGVDGGFVLPDVLTEVEIALDVRIDRGLDRLLGKGSHGKELVLEFGELLLEVNARHGLSYSPSIDCASRRVTGLQISRDAPETLRRCGDAAQFHEALDAQKVVWMF